MKSAVSSLVISKNLSHSAVSCSLLQHALKPISQRTFFIPTIPRNAKNLYNQRYQKLQLRPNSTVIMASSFKPEQARFKIGLCQLSVTPDKERNIWHARKAIEEAAQKGALLVLLPEIWNSPYSNDNFPVYAEDIDVGYDASPSTAMLSEVSSHLKVTIVGGSIPERCGDKLYNTCVFGTDGKLFGTKFVYEVQGRVTSIPYGSIQKMPSLYVICVLLDLAKDFIPEPPVIDVH